MHPQVQRPPIFPFFVGAPRSGTTLFRAIFDFHPGMAVPDESNFVPILGRSRSRYERPYGFAADALVEDLLRQRSFRRWGLTRDHVRNEFDAHPPRDYPDAIRGLFALFAQRQGKSRYADKTPRYILDIPLLAELFPEAKFIHIIRDGRDVALSVLDVDFGARSVGAAALSWKDFVKSGRESGRRLGSRYCEINYEDVLKDPEATIAPLCGFVDLQFDPAMLRYFERSERITAPAEWSRRHVLLPPTKGLRDWRSQMSGRDVVMFEALAGDMLEELGYERSVPQIPAPVLIRARAEVIGREARRFIRGARLPKTTPSGRGTAKPAPLLASPRSDRQEVLSFLLAREASMRGDVQAFRREVLDGRLLTLDGVPSWVMDEDGQTGTGTPAGILEYLGAEAWPLRQRTIEGGSLERLRLLGAGLSDVYGWEPAQATSFVLTGLSPLVPAIRCATVGGVPSSSTLRIVLAVDPVTSPRDLASYYKRARARETQDRSGSVTRKQLKLAAFVAERSEQSWPELMEAWNRNFPRSRYSDTKGFQRDAVSARRALLDPY